MPDVEASLQGDGVALPDSQMWGVMLQKLTSIKANASASFMRRNASELKRLDDILGNVQLALQEAAGKHLTHRAEAVFERIKSILDEDVPQDRSRVAALSRPVLQGHRLASTISVTNDTVQVAWCHG